LFVFFKELVLCLDLGSGVFAVFSEDLLKLEDVLFETKLVLLDVLTNCFGGLAGLFGTFSVFSLGFRLVLVLGFLLVI
jgi:hypothetical protein